MGSYDCIVHISIGSGIFHNFNVHKFYISHPCRRPHGWPKNAGIHYVFKLISIYLCAFAGTIIIYVGRTESHEQQIL